MEVARFKTNIKIRVLYVSEIFLIKHNKTKTNDTEIILNSKLITAQTRKKSSPWKRISPSHGPEINNCLRLALKLFFFSIEFQILVQISTFQIKWKKCRSQNKFDRW